MTVWNKFENWEFSKFDWVKLLLTVHIGRTGSPGTNVDYLAAIDRQIMMRLHEVWSDPAQKTPFWMLQMLVWHCWVLRPKHECREHGWFRKNRTAELTLLSTKKSLCHFGYLYHILSHLSFLGSESEKSVWILGLYVIIFIIKSHFKFKIFLGQIITLHNLKMEKIFFKVGFQY